MSLGIECENYDAHIELYFIVIKNGVTVFTSEKNIQRGCVANQYIAHLKGNGFLPQSFQSNLYSISLIEFVSCEIPRVEIKIDHWNGNIVPEIVCDPFPNEFLENPKCALLFAIFSMLEKIFADIKRTPGLKLTLEDLAIKFQTKFKQKFPLASPCSIQLKNMIYGENEKNCVKIIPRFTTLEFTHLTLHTRYVQINGSIPLFCFTPQYLEYFDFIYDIRFNRCFSFADRQFLHNEGQRLKQSITFTSEQFARIVRSPNCQYDQSFLGLMSFIRFILLTYISPTQARGIAKSTFILFPKTALVEIVKHGFKLDSGYISGKEICAKIWGLEIRHKIFSVGLLQDFPQNFASEYVCDSFSHFENLPNVHSVASRLPIILIILYFLRDCYRILKGKEEDIAILERQIDAEIASCLLKKEATKIADDTKIFKENINALYALFNSSRINYLSPLGNFQPKFEVRRTYDPQTKLFMRVFLKYYFFNWRRFEQPALPFQEVTPDIDTKLRDFLNDPAFNKFLADVNNSKELAEKLHDEILNEMDRYDRKMKAAISVHFHDRISHASHIHELYLQARRKNMFNVYQLLCADLPGTEPRIQAFKQNIWIHCHDIIRKAYTAYRRMGRRSPSTIPSTPV